MLLKVDEYYARVAESLPDEELQRELDSARRYAAIAFRTRKELARRRAYCFECELKRRAAARDTRNPGRA
jgi:phage terminase Nu1 subunit (DNA packaging protein)